MAKKRRISEENQEAGKIQQTDIKKESTTSSENERMSVQERESIMNYKPLNLSLKTHLLLAAVLFLLFSGIYLGYVKIATHYAQKYIDDGVNYLQIAEQLNKEDTGVIIVYQESPDYSKINELGSMMGRDLSNMFEFIKAKHISDSYVKMLNETKMLIPQIIKIIEGRINDNFSKLPVQSFRDNYKKTGDEMIKQIDQVIKLNEEIIAKNDFDKTKNRFLKYIVELKNQYFNFESQTLRLRGLWNRAAAFDAALELFQKAINVDNRNIDAYYNIAYVYEMMKEPELAGERYAHIIKLEPESELANKIFDKFRKAVDANPENLQDRYNLGMAYYRKNDKIKAEEQFKFIISKDPQMKTTLSFMSEKRIKEMQNPTPEVIYDPRL